MHILFTQLNNKIGRIVTLVLQAFDLDVSQARKSDKTLL